MVLVGHAYAGAVIAATRNEKVKALVYIAALAPDEGETVADVFYRAEPHPQAPKLAPDSTRADLSARGAFAAAFAQTRPPKNWRCWRRSSGRSRPPASASRSSGRCGRTGRAWFLVAEEDRMIVPETQRFMAGADEGADAVAPVDHTPIVTAPRVVVDIIREAIGRGRPDAAEP